MSLYDEARPGKGGVCGLAEGGGLIRDGLDKSFGGGGGGGGGLTNGLD